MLVNWISHRDGLVMFRIYAAVWLICGILAAGFSNASFKDEFHWSTKEKCEYIAATNQSFALIWGSLGGPISLVAALMFSGFGYKGWSLSKNKCEGY